jgi:hypothetical protein
MKDKKFECTERFGIFILVSVEAVSEFDKIS